MMLKKVFKIIILLSIPFLIGGCGKEESHFSNMSFNQNPIDLANPVTDKDEFVEDLKVVETDVSLYYDRYVPNENAYIPVQMANTDYTNDENGNQIPNSLIYEDFSRENLRNIDFLIEDYHIAKKNELNYTYNWKNKDDDSKDFFNLIQKKSILGKYKDNESVIFDDLIISTDYNFSNSNTPEVFSISLINLKNTEDAVKKSKGILENVLPEDISAYLLNSPNEVESDTIQSFNGTLGTENKNSTYTFYREFKTPLKDSSDKVSARFDVRFVDSYSQKQLQNKVVINKQKEDLDFQEHGVDWGDFASNRFFSIKGASNCFSELYRKKSLKSSYIFSKSYKDYENLKYIVFDETTNLNPADIINPYQEYSYDTHLIIKSKNRKEKMMEEFETGEINVAYKYKKVNNEFTSMNLTISDIFFIPGDSDITNSDTIIKDRIQAWLSPLDLSEINIMLNEDIYFYEDINNIRCKVSISPKTYEKESFIYFQIDIKIESDDIYGAVETEIVSVHEDIEYDAEGNVIQKEEVKESSEEIVLEDIEEEMTETEDINEDINTEEIENSENLVEDEDETKEEIESEDNSDISGGSLDDLF